MQADLSSKITKHYNVFLAIRVEPNRVKWMWVILQQNNELDESDSSSTDGRPEEPCENQY